MKILKKDNDGQQILKANSKAALTRGEGDHTIPIEDSFSSYGLQNGEPMTFKHNASGSNRSTTSMACTKKAQENTKNSEVNFPLLEYKDGHSLMIVTGQLHFSCIIQSTPEIILFTL